MSNNQKPDGWATLSPEGEYIGNDDEIHLDRTETVICAEDWADGYRVVPVCLISPQELAKLRAVSEWAKGFLDFLVENNYQIAEVPKTMKWFAKYDAITAPKENPNKSDLLREEG